MTAPPAANSRRRKEPATSREMGIKITEIRLKNFKLFSNFDLKFPEPRLSGDLDCLVIGGRNGSGKTSILEAIVLLFMTGALGQHRYVSDFSLPALISNLDLSETLIRSGKGNDAIIGGQMTVEGDKCSISSTLMSDERKRFPDFPKLEIHSGPRLCDFFGQHMPSFDEKRFEQLMPFLWGLAADPMILPPLLYLHSYRKVQEGYIEPNGLLDSDKKQGHRGDTIGAFKRVIFNLFIRGKGLIDKEEDREAIKALEKLNGLCDRFAAGRVESLSQSPEGFYGLPISPKNGDNPFPIDGLSSGQKSIISTFFLIWYYTLEIPGIVLIDEPELHLNAEWAIQFIRSLRNMAPNNQYIISTHSEEVFASVEPYQRILLTGPGDKE